MVVDSWRPLTSGVPEGMAESLRFDWLCCSCAVRLEVWFRGELEFWRLPPIWIGSDGDGIARMVGRGDADGNNGRWKSSSSSGGKSRSSLVNSSAEARWWLVWGRCLCRAKNKLLLLSSSFRARLGESAWQVVSAESEVGVPTEGEDEVSRGGGGEGKK